MRIQLSLILLLSLLAVILMPSVTLAGKDDAGEKIGDSVYVDNKFGFSFEKPATWKFKDIHKNKDVERVLLLQDNPTVPARYTRFRQLFTQPQITVLACEIDQNPKEYMDFLLAEDGKDDLKKKALDKFLLFQQDSKYTFEPQRPRSVKVGGHHGIKIVGKKQYSYQTEETGAMSDYLFGYIYIINAENGLVVMEFVCEREIQEQLEPDFDFLISSFTFTDSDKDSDVKDSDSTEE
ncbi:MAG: hypothetical protein KKH67_04980 [candidate division Zixibacteria bacterium]|nr:hypothetical protein [candidate division Zixibacteria bacterium]